MSWMRWVRPLWSRRAERELAVELGASWVTRAGLRVAYTAAFLVPLHTAMWLVQRSGPPAGRWAGPFIGYDLLALVLAAALTAGSHRRDIRRRLRSPVAVDATR